MSVESDFNIHRIIAASDPIINVRSQTTVDATSLNNVLRVIGRKIEQQDDEINRLKAEINDLRMEQAAFKTARAEHEALKEEVAYVARQTNSARCPAGEGSMRGPDKVMMHFTPSASATLQTIQTTTTTTTVPQIRGISQGNTPAADTETKNANVFNQSSYSQRSGVTTTSTFQNLPKTGIMMEADGGALRVLGVKPGSAAAQAGVRQGDAIHAVEDKPATYPKDFVDALTTKKVGDNFKLEVSSPGQAHRTLNLTLKAE